MGVSYLYSKRLNSKTYAVQENLSAKVNFNRQDTLITNEYGLFSVYMKCGELRNSNADSEKTLPWLFLLLCYYIKLGNLKNPAEKYYKLYKDVAENFAASEISKEFNDSKNYQIIYEIISGMDDKDLVDSDEEKVHEIYNTAMFFYEEKLAEVEAKKDPPELTKAEIMELIKAKHGKTEMVFDKEEGNTFFKLLKSYSSKLQYSLRTFLF